MLLSNSSITDVVEPANNISSSNLQLSGDKSQLPNFDATTNTFFFNADAKEQEQTQTTTTLSETADTGPPLPMVNIKSEEEPYIELPDIFPSIEEIGTQASLEEPIQPVASAAKKKETKIQMPAPKKQQTVKKEQQPTEKKRNPQNKKRNPRVPKKQKVEETTSTFIQTLKGLNSAELEAYASTHALTSQQQAELKEWIRKIKNRESASNSRKNRKNHQQILESQLEYLDTNNTRLQEEIKELEIENRVLRNELVQFRTLIEQSNLGQAFEDYSKRRAAGLPPSSPSLLPKNVISAVSPQSSMPTSAAPSPIAAQTEPLPSPVPVPSPDTVATLKELPSANELPVVVTADDAITSENDSIPLVPPTSPTPPSKDKIESYRTHALARLGEAVAKMVQNGKAKREDVALVLYLLIVLHQCGQFLSAPTSIASSQMPVSETVSVVV